MSRQIVAGIDIGTSITRVVIAEAVFEGGHPAPRIIASGAAETRGLERGYVKDIAEATQSIRAAVDKAEKGVGTKIRRAYVSFGGLGLASITATGSVVITRADLEITERDIQLALETAEALIPPAVSINKRIINTIPIEYKIDGKPAWGNPLGLKAHKLEAKALFITCLERHLANLIKAVEEADIEVVDVVAAPIAASFVTVSKRERRVGCLLVNIGAETMSVITFENGNPISLEVFPVGGEDFTNDIALGLRISLEEAETAKLGGFSRVSFPKKKLDEIVAARLSDCFELIERHLKIIGRDELLPAGIILAGGNSKIPGLKAFAEEALHLPSSIAEIHFGGTDKGKIKDNGWATACGLVVLGFNSDGRKSIVSIDSGEKIVKKISRWFAQFLP